MPATPDADPATTVDALVAAARAGLDRFDVARLTTARLDPRTVVVDIRPRHQRELTGEIPGSVVIERNVLEWRLEPGGAHRTPEVAEDPGTVVVVCHEGYASSLAAASLRSLGVDATDLDGGVVAWIAAGHPVVAATS